MNHELLKQQLVGAYLSAKASNTRFSKRALAKKLGISHGPLIEIMNGKRQVSPKMASKLCERLSLSPKQMNLVTSPKKILTNDEFELKEDQFFLISDITHFSFLNLIKIKNQSHEATSLARRLGVSEDRLKNIINRLLRLELVAIKNNKYVRTKQAIKTSDDILSMAIRASHKATLEITAQKIDETPVHLRDVTSIVMPVNTKKLKAAKELIRKFQDDLESLLEDSKADEVYTFNMQLIPLTKNGDQQ